MRENCKWIKDTISHIETEKIPYNFFFTPLALKKAESYYGSPIDEKLDYPIRIGGLKSIKPVYAEPFIYGKYTRDEFGVLWTTGVIDRGVPIGPCIVGQDLEKY
jgi:hypothetical protein